MALLDFTFQALIVEFLVAALVFICIKHCFDVRLNS